MALTASTYRPYHIDQFRKRFRTMPPVTDEPLTHTPWRLRLSRTPFDLNEGELIQEVLTTESPSHDAIEQWILGGNEPALWVLTTRRTDILQERYDDRQVELRKHLVQRAFDLAEVSGHVWTPLIDALEARPGTFFWDWGRGFYDYQDVVGPLMDWIDTRTRLRELKPLYRFWGEDITDALPDTILQLGPDDLQATYEADETDVSDELYAALWHVISAYSRTGWAWSFLEYGAELATTGRDVPDFALECARDVAHADLLLDGPNTRAGEAAALLLSRAPNTPDAVLHEVYDLTTESHAASPQVLLEHPELPYEMVLRFMDDLPSDGAVRSYAARYPDALDDPDIRPILESSTALGVRTSLCRAAEPEAFPAQFRKLLARDHDAALSVLESASDAQARTLQRRVLLDLLESDSPDIRLRAVAVLSRIQGPDAR